MAPRQNLPIVLDYGDGRPGRSVTRTLDRSGVSFYLDAEMPVPHARHRDELRGAHRRRRRPRSRRGREGRARGRRDRPRDGRDLHRRRAARCGRTRDPARAFRERVVEFATKHRDGEKILEAAGGGLTRRMRPDTTPVRPREAHWVPEPYVRSPSRRRRPSATPPTASTAGTARASRRRRLAASGRVPPGTTGRSRTGSSAASPRAGAGRRARRPPASRRGRCASPRGP